MRECAWCSTVDGGFQRLLKWRITDVKNITGDDQVTLAIVKITLSYLKFIFLLLDAAILTLLCTYFSYSTSTRKGFHSYLPKIMSRRPWPPLKKRDIHIKACFFADFIFTNTIDIMNMKIKSVFKQRAYMCDQTFGQQHQDPCSMLVGG